MRSTRRQNAALSGAGIASMKQNAPSLPISIASLLRSYFRFGLQTEQRERLTHFLDLSLVFAVERRKYLNHSFHAWTPRTGAACCPGSLESSLPRPAAESARRGCAGPR